MIRQSNRVSRTGVHKGEKKKCRFCGTVLGKLMVHSGKNEEVTYYSCRPCMAKYKRKWYNKGNNKEKQQEYNRRYLLKLKGKK